MPSSIMNEARTTTTHAGFGANKPDQLDTAESTEINNIGRETKNTI